MEATRSISFLSKRERRTAMFVALIALLLTLVFLFLLKLTVPDPPISTIPEPMEMLVEAPPPAASGGASASTSETRQVDPYKSPTQEEPSEVQAVDSDTQNEGQELVDAEPTEPTPDNSLMLDAGGNDGQGGQGSGNLGNDTGYGNNGVGPGIGGDGNGTDRKIINTGSKPVAPRSGEVMVRVFIDANGIAQEWEFVKISIEALRQPTIQKIKTMRWNKKPGQVGYEAITYKFKFSEQS